MDYDSRKTALATHQTTHAISYAEWFHGNEWSNYIEWANFRQRLRIDLIIVSRHPAGKRGFTIVESIIAFAVLVVSTLVTLGVLASTFSNVDQNSDRIQAITAAQQYMDSLRDWEANGGSGTMPAAPSIQIDAGDKMQGNGTAVTSPGSFDFTTVPATCAQTGSGGASSKEYDCKVTVRWAISGYTRQVAVESYVTQQ